MRTMKPKEPYVNDYGSRIEMKEYLGKGRCIVQITTKLNNNITKTKILETTVSCFTNHQIISPYDKTIANIGYFGEGIYKISENKKPTTLYQRFYTLLVKYGDNICDEWLNFQTFCKWYEAHVDINREYITVKDKNKKLGPKNYKIKTRYDLLKTVRKRKRSTVSIDKKNKYGSRLILKEYRTPIDIDVIVKTSIDRKYRYQCVNTSYKNYMENKVYSIYDLTVGKIGYIGKGKYQIHKYDFKTNRYIITDEYYYFRKLIQKCQDNISTSLRCLQDFGKLYNKYIEGKQLDEKLTMMVIQKKGELVTANDIIWIPNPLYQIIGRFFDGLLGYRNCTDKYLIDKKDKIKSAIDDYTDHIGKNIADKLIHLI